VLRASCITVARSVLFILRIHLENTWAELYFNHERSIHSRRVRNLCFVIRLGTYGLPPGIIDSRSFRQMTHGAIERGLFKRRRVIIYYYLIATLMIYVYFITILLFRVNKLCNSKTCMNMNFITSTRPCLCECDSATLAPKLTYD
jgi:hypothetical protein